ncbi:hypothetical protein MLD38_009550 [Melastoma candidum]|uniref:Uncharacterized protein n=1 Tax=Melastoma candidum TaxID=119954 RepID=A0ACB9RX09_9MYRT|nr:hypothetical protein MLD38_009550 [Melastoma candidum]
MKRSPLPVFSLLLISVVAFTLSSRSYLRRHFDGSSRDDEQLPTAFDPVLLSLASNYTSDAMFGAEIERLLQGNFSRQARIRTFSMWRRIANRHDVSSSQGGSIDDPRLYWYWMDFRRNLRDWSIKRRFDNEVMFDLAELVKHPLDVQDGRGGGGRKYRSCAVIGNSGILLEKEYGKLIDSHEVVVRLNNARIRGYERSVGSRTSISFVNSNILHLCTRRERCYCHPYGVDVPIVMYICQPAHLLDYTACNSAHRSPLLITDPRFDMLCARIVKYYSLKRFVEDQGRNFAEWDQVHHEPEFHYSSGMQAVMLAVGICDRVSLFGFGKSDKSKHHYHTNQKTELSLHDYSAEYDIYHDLVERPRAIPFISDKFQFPPLAIYR